MNVRRIILIAAVLLTVASAATASNFRAADTVYLAAAGRFNSADGGDLFVTDAFITNLTTTKVVVSVAFGESGEAPDNSQITKSLKTLATPLEPGERRLVSDITGTLFPEKNGKLGFLIFFACRDEGNCSDCDSNAADCSLIAVESRVYSTPLATPADGTTGQQFPGYPWFSLVSPNDAALALDKVYIVGLRSEGVVGTNGFRTNIGILNASQDYTADVRVSVYSSTGALIGEKVYELKALGHIQKDIRDVAPSFETSNSTGYAILQQVGSSLVPGGCAACTPGFFAYGSALDNVSEDPTTLETVYDQQLDIRCVYGSKADRRPARR